MPNISYNQLRVKGSREELQKFYKAFRGHWPYYWIDETLFQPYPKEPHPYLMDKPALEGESCKEYNLRMEKELETEPEVICFNAIYPVPKDIRMGGFSKVKNIITVIDGYSWQTSNWGTKWELFELTDFEEKDDCGVYEFETAWSAPFQWIEYASKKFPNLRFIISYDNEFGMVGEHHIENGRFLFEATDSASTTLRYWLIYAHILENRIHKSIRGVSLQNSMENKTYWSSGMQWAIRFYNQVKKLNPSDVHSKVFTKKMTENYLNKLKEAAGKAAITSYEGELKEIKKAERNINIIRKDLRGH